MQKAPLEQLNKYRSLALGLLKRYSAEGLLDPMEVIQMIPEEWDLSSSDFDLTQYLTNMFNRLMTIEENAKIAQNMSNMEILNKEKDLNKLQQRYVVIDDQFKCQVCHRALDCK